MKQKTTYAIIIAGLILILALPGTVLGVGGFLYEHSLEKKLYDFSLETAKTFMPKQKIVRNDPAIIKVIPKPRLGTPIEPIKRIHFLEQVRMYNNEQIKKILKKEPWRAFVFFHKK